MHSSTFNYNLPTQDQLDKMVEMREAARIFCEAIERLVPDGPDKTFIIRNHRTTAMWANVAITRQPDGTPRE